MPVSSAICDIVTDRSPCSASSAAVVSRIASRTAARCALIVSFYSFGITPSASSGSSSAAQQSVSFPQVQ
jgi:hypothetical protein